MNKDEILNKTIKEVENDLMNEGLDTAFANLTTNFIKIYVEGIEKQKKETEYWKNKAYIIWQYSNIGRKECPKHDTHTERTFDPWKAIEERKCLTCEAQGKSKIFRGECRVNKK